MVLAMEKTKVVKTEAEWKSQLTPEQYRVTRQKGTEPAFLGKYANEHADGLYHCVCCGAPLFDSGKKFESGSGWPSFTQPVSGEAIRTETDETHGMRRVEVLCSTCDAHLGHVFPDGPKQAGGLRYCMNSASLDLKKSEAEKK